MILVQDAIKVLDDMWARGRLAESVTLPGDIHQAILELALAAAQEAADKHASDCDCDICTNAREVVYAVRKREEAR